MTEGIHVPHRHRGRARLRPDRAVPRAGAGVRSHQVHQPRRRAASSRARRDGRPPVPRLEVKRQMGGGDIAAVSALLDLATAVDRHRPLGEHQWLDLVQGGREGFAGLVAWEPGHDHPVAYAQLTRGPESWALEYVID